MVFLICIIVYGHCSLKFPYKVDVPLVTLIVEDEWNSVADATARFKLAPNFSRSSWDWIGLYKVSSVRLTAFRGEAIKIQYSRFDWSTVLWLRRCPSGGFQTPQGLRGICVGQAGGGWLSSTRTSGNWDERLVLWRAHFLSYFSDVWWAVFQVTFTEEELPKGSGDFILGYYSNNMSTIVGVTEPFQVIITLALAPQA